MEAAMMPMLSSRLDVWGGRGLGLLSFFPWR